jgi:hypothetical protein
MQMLKNQEPDSVLLSPTAQQAFLSGAWRRAGNKRPRFERPLMERKRIPVEDRQTVRMDKIANLRRALANHTYLVSSQDVATKLIDHLLSLGS